MLYSRAEELKKLLHVVWGKVEGDAAAYYDGVVWFHPLAAQQPGENPRRLLALNGGRNGPVTEDCNTLGLSPLEGDGQLYTVVGGDVEGVSMQLGALDGELVLMGDTEDAFKCVDHPFQAALWAVDWS